MLLALRRELLNRSSSSTKSCFTRLFRTLGHGPAKRLPQDHPFELFQTADFHKPQIVCLKQFGDLVGVFIHPLAGALHHLKRDLNELRNVGHLSRVLLSEGLESS